MVDFTSIFTCNFRKAKFVPLSLLDVFKSKSRADNPHVINNAPLLAPKKERQSTRKMLKD